MKTSESSKHQGSQVRGFATDPGERGVALVPPPIGIGVVDRVRERLAVQSDGRDPSSPPDGGELARRVAAGFSGPSTALPHLERIRPAFGRHAAALEQVAAHVGGPAATATRALRASAFTSGGSIAFAGPPSLRTAAHEAAHVIHQSGGTESGLGASGDSYERHADEVAEAVVAGRSAEGLLARRPGPAAVPAVQCSWLVGEESFDLGPQRVGRFLNIPIDAAAARAAQLEAIVQGATPVTSSDKNAQAYFSRIEARSVDGAYVFKLPHLAVDNDGAPNAYHPPTAARKDGRIAYPGGRHIIDHIANATDSPDHPPYLDAQGNVKLPKWTTKDKHGKEVKHESQWVGVALDHGGSPYVQGPRDPFPGAYLSKSTLQDERYTEQQVERYADATVIPYVALPGHINSQTSAGAGDLVAVVMLSDPGPKRRATPRLAFGIVGDVAPKSSNGEASRALCANLGVPSGLTERNAEFVWIVFPRSRESDPSKRGWWKDVEALVGRARARFEGWGGLELIQALYPTTPPPIPPLRL